MSEIIKLKPGDPDFQLFEKFPERIYSSASPRFKLPESLNTEFLESCYLLADDGVIKARAALYNNPYLFYQNHRAFCIGNYESVEDINTSSKLLEHVAMQAKEQGAQYLIGPMNGSTWDNYRFSTHHDYPNFFLEPYQHIYYNDQFSRAGFQVIASYFSSVDRNMAFDQAESAHRENEFSKAGVTIRTIDLSDFENELTRIFELSLIAFKTNFLYTPITKDTFLKKYLETKKVIDPEFVLLAQHDNDLVGFLFCINDLFNTHEKSLTVKTAARHPDKKWSGLGHVLLSKVYRMAADQKYQSIIHAFMYDQGTSVGITKDFSGNPFKNYALYGKQL